MIRLRTCSRWKWRRGALISDSKLKRCRACGIEKPLVAFAPSLRHPQHTLNRCDQCRIEARQQSVAATLSRRAKRRESVDLLAELRCKSVQARFWAKVVQKAEDECWPWSGSVDNDGYGGFYVGLRLHKAHRIAWQMRHNLLMPAGLFACHACDNPNCVNPAHIWPGSNQENLRDAADKGRLRDAAKPAQAARRSMTECKRGHKYVEGSFYKRKDGGRDCKACRSLTKASAPSGKPDVRRRKRWAARGVVLPLSNAQCSKIGLAKDASKRCTHPAVNDGYCHLHLSESVE